jgi:hypothetical protein
MNDAAFTVSAMAKTTNVALNAETKRLDASTRELQKTEASARLLIVRTNESLNGGPNGEGLLPSAAASLRAIGDLSSRSAADIDRIAEEAQPAIANATRATATLADSAADPNIKLAIANAAQFTGHANESMVHVEGMTEDGQKMLDKFTGTYMKPKNFAYALAKETFDWIWKAKSVF